MAAAELVPNVKGPNYERNDITRYSVEYLFSLNKGQTFKNNDTICNKLEELGILKLPPMPRKKPAWALKNESDQIISKAKLILNKMTPEKFDKLSDQFILLINNKKLLSKTVQIIVEKAQMEKNFSSIYADLCVKLDQATVENVNISQGEYTFKDHLIIICQKEFEKDINEIISNLKKIEDEEERNEKIILARNCYYGHIKFIGCLFKVNILNSKLIDLCVNKLFGDLEFIDEEKIHSLCTLMDTIGSQLDNIANNSTKKSKKYLERINKYFSNFDKLSSNKMFSNRIRYKILDLIELRANNWIPRRKIEHAKTLKEIKKEADDEYNRLNQYKNVVVDI